MSRRVVVLGGTGFLGGAVVRRLLAAGRPVRIVARRRPSEEGLHAVGPQPEFHAADIRDGQALKEALCDADAVVNAVSLYVQRRGGPSFDEIHVKGARRVATLVGQEGIGALVHVSGIGVDEASPSPYVRARALGERYVREVLPEAVILRPSVLFGPRDAFLRSLDMITRLPVVPLFGRGSTRLQPVYVEDMAEAVVQALERPGARGRVFELGGAGVYGYREIIGMVLTHSGRRRPRLPVPFALWHGLAALASLLPEPPLTHDQVHLMETDNVVSPGAAGFAALGVTPRALDALLAQCLKPGSG